MAVGDTHFPEGTPIVHSGRYLDANADSDATATFIDADTNTGGAFTFSLRDEDHSSGMHYHVRVDVGTSLLTVKPKTGSTKTISGKFAGQTFTSASQVAIYKDDGLLRVKPDGSNWSIY